MSVDYTGSHALPRVELGVAANEFIQQQDEFIGTKVLPIFGTKKKESIFPAITRESITRDADTKRAPRGNYNRDSFSAKDLSYSCIENGLEGALDDGERALYASDFDAELVTVQIISRRLLQAQERRISALIFNTTTWTGSDLFTDNSASPWTNVASDVIAQVRAAKAKVRNNTGLVPNALILSETNIDRLKANTLIKDAIKYTARTTDAELFNALADIFGVKRIINAKGIRNSSKEGKPFVSADIWSDLYAMLAWVAEDGKDLSQPALGRTFLWETDTPENATVEQYRDEDIRSDIFRVRHHAHEMVVDKYFGHLMKVA